MSAGHHDLSLLAIIPGLSEDDFRRHIVAILDQTPVVQEISSLSRRSAITSETTTALIGKVMDGIPSPAYDSEIYCLALKKWLHYFFPDLYRVRAAVEVFEQTRFPIVRSPFLRKTSFAQPPAVVSVSMRWIDQGTGDQQQ